MRLVKYYLTFNKILMSTSEKTKQKKHPTLSRRKQPNVSRGCGRNTTNCKLKNSRGKGNKQNKKFPYLGRSYGFKFSWSCKPDVECMSIPLQYSGSSHIWIVMTWLIDFSFGRHL